MSSQSLCSVCFSDTKRLTLVTHKSKQCTTVKVKECLMDVWDEWMKTLLLPHQDWVLKWLKQKGQILDRVWQAWWTGASVRKLQAADSLTLTFPVRPVLWCYYVSYLLNMYTLFLCLAIIMCKRHEVLNIAEYVKKLQNCENIYLSLCTSHKELKNH